MDDDDFMLYGEALSPKGTSPEVAGVVESGDNFIEKQEDLTKDFTPFPFQDVSFQQEETLDEDAFDEPSELLDDTTVLTPGLSLETPGFKESFVAAVGSTQPPFSNSLQANNLNLSPADDKNSTVSVEQPRFTLPPSTSSQAEPISNLPSLISKPKSPQPLITSPSGIQIPVLTKETGLGFDTSDTTDINKNQSLDIPELTLLSDSESEDSVDIIIEQPTTAETADLLRLNVLESRSKTDNPPTAGLSLGNGLDLDTPAFLDGVPLFDVVLDDFEDKPWRKPGADRTDYFNYGFDERTWSRYAQRQQFLRDPNNLVSHLGPHLGPNRAFAPDSGHNNGPGAGMPHNMNRSGPVRFTLEAAFPRQQNINQPNGEVDRDRDSMGGYPVGLGNRHSRAPFHMYQGQNNSNNPLPPLSYSFNAPSIPNRGMHGFTPSFLPPPIANARPAKNWRPRSPSPLVEDRESHPRDNYSKRYSSRSPSPSRSPRTRHRSRPESFRDPGAESRDARDPGRKGTPVTSSGKDSTRERRHRRDDQDGETDSLRSHDFKEPKENRSSKEISSIKSRESKDRDRSSHHESSRDLRESSKDFKDRDRSERRRDKEREKDKDLSTRPSSHGNIPSSADSQLKIKSDSHRSNRDKEKERDKDKDRERERKHSSDRQAEKISESQQRRSIKDRLGSKIAAEESSSSSRKRSKTDKDDSKKHRH